MQSLAPEVLDDGAASFSTASDVWAAALAAAELLSGKRPFNEVSKLLLLLLLSYCQIPNSLLLARLQTGLRPEKSPSCSDEVCMLCHPDSQDAAACVHCIMCAWVRKFDTESQMHEVVMLALALRPEERPSAANFWRYVRACVSHCRADAPVV